MEEKFHRLEIGLHADNVFIIVNSFQALEFAPSPACNR